MCGPNKLLENWGMVYVLQILLCRTTFVANQNTCYIPSDIHTQHSSLQTYLFYQFQAYKKQLQGIKQNKRLSKSARHYFLVGHTWRCTSPFPFRRGPRTPSANSALGNNFWQTCRLRLFCYKIFQYPVYDFLLVKVKWKITNELEKHKLGLKSQVKLENCKLTGKSEINWKTGN